MRIISGMYKGRKLKEPADRTAKPMSSRAKQALFNSIGDVTGLKVFDPFAGSGAIGLEAASRGAASVICTERNPRIFKLLKENVTTIDKHDLVVYEKRPMQTWLKDNQQATFNLIICDPPYDEIRRDHLMLAGQRLEEGGLLVLSLPDDYDEIEIEGLELIKVSSYARASLRYYRTLD